MLLNEDISYNQYGIYTCNFLYNFRKPTYKESLNEYINSAKQYFQKFPYYIIPYSTDCAIYKLDDCSFLLETIKKTYELNCEQKQKSKLKGIITMIDKLSDKQKEIIKKYINGED